jgi:glycosyltransferase involved in cell wall biosynthesis
MRVTSLTYDGSPLTYMTTKITIVTVCFNSADTIRDTIESVLNQTYVNLEYIIVDGGSTDDTMQIVSEYESRIAKVVSEPDKGIYDAMNKGIGLATGDVIGILNSDDFYASSDVIAVIMYTYHQNQTDILFGDLIYVARKDVSSAVRIYNSAGFRPWMLRFGWMPPHPATFIKRSVYQEFGGYAMGYKTAADYEIFVRLLLVKKLNYLYLNKNIVYMRVGGATSSGWQSYFTTSLEMVRAVKKNGFYTNVIIILIRLPIKIFELIRWRGAIG